MANASRAVQIVLPYLHFTIHCDIILINYPNAVAYQV